MTGPEHYREAERLLSNPLSAEGTRKIPGHPAHQAMIAEAQVHATLAGVYAHNRATTELTGLLHAMLDQIREAQEAQA